MDYNGPPASEYRLNIDGISVFCPCGELLWLFDGSSIDILRKHFRKCRIYTGIKNFPFKKIVSEFNGNFAKKVSSIAIHEFGVGDKKYYCKQIGCTKSNVPFQRKQTAEKHQVACGHSVGEMESVYHVSHPQHLIRKGALENLTITDVVILSSSADNVYNLDVFENNGNSLENIGVSNEVIELLEGRGDIYIELTAKYFSKYPSLIGVKVKIESRVENINWSEQSKKWIDIGIGLNLEPSYHILVMNFAHHSDDEGFRNRSSFKLPKNLEKTKNELKYLMKFLNSEGCLQEFEPNQKFIGIIILKNFFPNVSITPLPNEPTTLDNYIAERLGLWFRVRVI